MSTLFFLVITTAIAMGALMLSTVQVKVASSVARWEAAYSAADGGINYALPMIKYGHFDGFIPPQYCGFISGGCGLPGAPPPFVTELQTDLYNPDTSNILIPDNPGATGLAYIVNIDVDPIGTSISAGSGIEAAWAYQGFLVVIFNFRGTGASEGNFDILGWARDLEGGLDCRSGDPKSTAKEFT